MTLALFPLNTVLFPGCVLDLQIFEARYLDMVSRCMRQGESFGVVCILEGRETGEAARQFAAVGCEAQIIDFEQRPNGLLGIRVKGGRRFNVEQAQVQTDQLTIANVAWLNEPEDLALEAEHADLAALLSALAQHPMVRELNMSDTPSGQLQLANQLAYLLPLKPEQKLQVLAVDQVQPRLALVESMLVQLQGD